MVAAEVRYVGSWFAVVAIVTMSAALVAAIGHDAHLDALTGTGLTIVFMCVFGCAGLPLWYKLGYLSEPKVCARYAPLVIQAAVFLVQAYWIAIQVARLNATHWQHGVGGFAWSCFSMCYLTIIGSRDIRRRYRREPAERS